MQDNGTVTRTTCPYCGVGCGIEARVSGAGEVSIAGDPLHPANRGALCAKGYALTETLDHAGRLLYPEVDGRVVAWDQALAVTAARLQRVIADHGPEAVAFYVSGQMLTEDYYVANKLMKGFIGSANIDSNSRLCMASAVAGYKRAFGTDTVPCGYADLDEARLFILAGANAAWCHPVLFQRIETARQQHPERKLIVIDPRRTATCATADLHLPLKPGADAWLFNGLLVYLADTGVLDRGFSETHTAGLEATLAAARETTPSIARVAGICDLPARDVASFYELFAQTDQVLTLFSQGINQSTSGADKVNSIINCHLATGRIGKPGAGPFSLTGQPNAMGGREVGGLANQLAAHMDLGNPEHRAVVQSFWQSPALPEAAGRMAVDMFTAIAAGEIKAIWIMATNPAVSLPDADRARAALAQCPLVIVSDCMRETDTTALAHILLPAETWSEKNGAVTNAERRISRQRGFLPAPGEARPDWWIISRVAQRLGFEEQFNYRSAAEIFREHAALSGIHNDGSRSFDISALGDISDREYESLEPVQWPLPRGRDSVRPFADGRYFHPDGKARLIPVTPRAPGNPVSPEHPLILNNGRVRDHWHTMTRTGKSPRLTSHCPEPRIELHPEDARRYGLHEGGLARVTSRWGTLNGRVLETLRQRRGEVFVPMHWNDRFAAEARTGAVVNPLTDPISGQPEFKHTPVRIEALHPIYVGLLLTRHEIELSAPEYRVKSRARDVWVHDLAGFTAVKDWPAWSRAILDARQSEVEWVEYRDQAAGHYRAACLVAGCLTASLHIARKRNELPNRASLMRLFRTERLGDADRRELLAGLMDDRPDPGPVVCACHGTGRNVILGLIYQQGLRTVDAIGRQLRAGTRCGACLPELRELLAFAGRDGW